jgi:hypothetical protein
VSRCCGFCSFAARSTMSFRSLCASVKPFFWSPTRSGQGFATLCRSAQRSIMAYERPRVRTKTTFSATAANSSRADPGGGYTFRALSNPSPEIYYPLKHLGSDVYLVDGDNNPVSVIGSKERTLRGGFRGMLTRNRLRIYRSTYRLITDG